MRFDALNNRQVRGPEWSLPTR